MIKIKNIIIRDNPDAGCTNGNFRDVKIQFNNGSEICGYTCRCGNGCSGSDRISHLFEGMEVEVNSVDSLLSSIDNDDELWEEEF